VLVRSKGNYPIVDLDFVQAGLHFSDVTEYKKWAIISDLEYEIPIPR